MPRKPETDDIFEEIRKDGGKQRVAELSEKREIKTLGNLIRKTRFQKGLARTKLAEFAGISPNSMVKYEMAGEPGGQYPSLLKMVRLCEILKLDPRYVFQMLISSGEIEPVDKTFNFSDHFRSRAQWENFDYISHELYGLNEHVGEIFDHIKSMQTEMREITKSIKENGPDQNDPSRHPQNPSTAVDAALTPPKEEDQT